MHSSDSISQGSSPLSLCNVTTGTSVKVPTTLSTCAGGLAETCGRGEYTTRDISRDFSEHVALG